MPLKELFTVLSAGTAVVWTWSGAEFCWGVGRMAELAAVHPRLRLLREQSVAEGYGWVGIALDALWRPWLGAPVYGVATLGVGDGSP